MNQPSKPALEFAGFSCPQAGLDPELMDVIVSGHADQLISNLLELHADVLRQSATGLTDVLGLWLARPPGAQFETVWDAALGDLHALLLSQSKEDVLRSAAAMALRLHACGQTGAWEVRLPQPASLRFGPWVLPSAQVLQVLAEGKAQAQRVALRLYSNGQWRSLVFARAPGGTWAPAEALPLPFQGSGHPDFRFQVASEKGLSEQAALRLLRADAYQFAASDMAVTDAWLATCRQALELLAATSAQYVTWVDRVLRDLVPLRAKPAQFNSGSDKYSPGVVCVCDHPYRWPLAEMLVHEASHQYLHILNRLGPLDDGSDTRLYYSPFRNKDRPLFFIVVAYHAFANVLLFYRQARAKGLVPEQTLRSEAFSHREQTLQAQLQQLEGPLMQTRALTPLGRALWEPLYAELAAP